MSKTKVSIREIAFFTKVLQLFRNCDRITFEIDSNYFKITCFHIFTLYYASLENSIFCVESGEEKLFTVNPKLFVKYLHFFRSSFLIEAEDFLKFRSVEKEDFVEAEIPFNALEEHEYTFYEANVKLLVKKANLMQLFTGNVIYESREGKLILTKNEGEAKDVVCIKEIEWLKEGYLYFPCNNDWSSCLEILNECIESLLIEFSAYVMSVKFLFKKFNDSYLEIQIPKDVGTKNFV